MKENTKNTMLLIACLFCSVMFFRFLKVDTKEKKIDYPEEIQEAKQGDTLTIYKVSADTIYLGFDNLRNR